MTTTRSVLGNLTTTFVPSSTCTFYAPMADSMGGFQGQGCNSGNSIVDASKCWPPATVSGPSPPLEGWGFYSPGLICPLGYVTACSSISSSAGQPSPTSQGSYFPFEFPLIAGETALGCCPDGFDCQIDGFGHQTCSSIATSASFLLGDCTGGSLGGFNFISVPTTTTEDTGSVATITTANLLAPLFQLNFQPSDLPSSTSSTTINTSTTTSTTTTSQTPSSVPEPSPVPDTGLSVGAKAAIGTVIPVFFIVVAAIWAFILIRRRRRQRQAQQPAPTASSRYEKPELDSRVVGHDTLKTELPTGSTARTELDAGARSRVVSGLHESDARSIHGID